MADWQSLLATASRLRREGRIDEAIAAYRRLLHLRPELADSWYNLGWLQKQARQFDAALESYARALDAGVSGAEEVHLNRAAILTDHLHRPNDAKAELERALSIASDYVPALLNLGNWFEDQGHRAEARMKYDRVLELQPDHALALARLAGLSHASDLDESLAGRIRSALESSDLSPDQRADLGFALASMLDAAGRYDEAFAAVTDANCASRAAGGALARYDPGATETMVDRLIAAFNTPAKAKGDPDEAPIFICGLFRSGSTLAERILATSKAVVPAGELDLIPALARAIPGYPEAAAAASRETIESWRTVYCRALPALPARVRRVTDKRPDNFLHLGLIKRLFPTARIIHTTRDPLDNLLSLYFLHLDPTMAYALDLDDLGHWHRQYRRLMAHWERLFGKDMLTLDYDALVRDPGAETRKLFDFCGLEWAESALNFEAASGPVRTASVWQVREPLYTRSSGRAENYRAHLKRISGTLIDD